MKHLLFLILFVFSSTLSYSQKKINPDRVFTPYLEKVMKDWGVPGMSVGIVKDGKLVYAKGFGTKKVGTNERPDEHTLYAIASNSKAFTSAVMAMLVEEGQLNWDDRVQEHLPYFEIYDPFISTQVTVTDLLSHRVGLGTFSGDIMWYSSTSNSEEIIRRAKYIPQAYPFRAGYGYSNVMYITAGEVIKTVTGKSWFDNVNERILQPLEMYRTTIYLNELEQLGNVATPHALIEEKNVPMRWVSWEEIASTGGLISSVSDLSKWLIMNMNHGVWKKDTLFSISSRNKMWTPHNNFQVDHTNYGDEKTHFSAYGLGWGLRDYYGQLLVRHSGGYDGMISYINMIPEENLGVIVLTNGMNSPIAAVNSFILDTYLTGSSKDWSTEILERRAKTKDTRIEERIESRKKKTMPSLSMLEMAGTYHSDLYGEMIINAENETLTIEFTRTPDLKATLWHWHFDTWKLEWEKVHAWFDFGTVQFSTNHQHEVTGITFDVPNNDFFFEEINARKVH